MTGLRSRLEAVAGVEQVELTLGRDGLEGISVSLTDGADEASVLEGIRRLLVAYGTRLPSDTPLTVSAAAGAAPVVPAAEVGAEEEPEEEPGVDPGVEHAVEHAVIDLDELSSSDSSQDEPRSAQTTTAGGSTVELTVVPVGDGSVAQVSMSWDGRHGRRQVPASARAVVQAVIDVGSDLVGHDPISVMGMNLSSIGGTRVLTVIVGNHGSAPRVCTSSVVDQNWPGALLDIATQVLTPVPVETAEAP